MLFILGSIRTVLRWSLAPVLIVLLGVMEHLPIQVGGSQAYLPFLAIGFAIAFSTRRSGYLPPIILFACVMVLEWFSAATPGTSAIAAMVVAYILLTQREFLAFAPYFALWAAFGGIMALYALVLWGTQVGYNGLLLPGTELVIRTLLTIAIFPALKMIAEGLDALLWPVRRTDERLADEEAIFIEPGAVPPKAIIRNTKPSLLARWRENFARRMGRRVIKEKTETPKPWMEI